MSLLDIRLYEAGSKLEHWSFLWNENRQSFINNKNDSYNLNKIDSSNIAIKHLNV